MKSITYKKIQLNNYYIDIMANIYVNNSEICKGVLLYFHGGGLIYGTKEDLPQLHIDKLCNAGYAIISYDYRLAPETKFPSILEDVLDGMHYYIENKDFLGFSNCPYYLWGRSAGAYICLLAANQVLKEKPQGIISYYGYSFSVPNWFNSGNPFYLTFPFVKEDLIKTIIEDKIITSGPIEKRFVIYLYARQRGNWLSLIYGSESEFLSKYSLKHNVANLPPVFLAHNFKDKDVPYTEALALSKMLKNTTLYSCSANDHDFDRNIRDRNTINLLDKTIDFLNEIK